jgi:ankyrin repeat protein
MQTENKLEIYELLVLTSEEANKLFSKEFWKERPDLQLIEDILAYISVDVNVQDEDGNTALMNAAYMGKEKCVELLLGYPGIDVNLQDYDGWTALMWAADRGEEKPVELLLNHPGIKVNMEDEGGQTAWDLATDSIRQRFPQLNPRS